MLKTGIPRGIVERVLGFVNLQIDPLIVRGYLKLKIVIYALRLRIKENFDNVSVPKLPSLRPGIFPFVNVQGVVATRKGEVDMGFRPERCDARYRFWIMELA